MPNGVRKSQKSAHANNQRNKMAEKHTAEMDDIRTKHQEELKVLDQRNKELTSEIAIAVKKLEKMEESEQIARLRLRLKEVRAKEKQSADDYLATMTKLGEQLTKNSALTKIHEKDVKDSCALVEQFASLTEHLIKDARSAEEGLNICKSLKRFGKQEHPHIVAHLWKKSSPMQTMLNKAIASLKERTLHETTSMEKQIRLVMDEYEASERYVKKKEKLGEIFDMCRLHYDQCWCKHDTQYCDPVAPKIQEWAELDRTMGIVRKITIKSETTTTTTTTTTD